MKKIIILSPKSQKNTIKQEMKKITSAEKMKKRLSEDQKDLIVKSNILINLILFL